MYGNAGPAAPTVTDDVSDAASMPVSAAFNSLFDFIRILRSLHFTLLKGMLIYENRIM